MPRTLRQDINRKWDAVIGSLDKAILHISDLGRVYEENGYSHLCVACAKYIEMIQLVKTHIEDAKVW